MKTNKILEFLTNNKYKILISLLIIITAICLIWGLGYSYITTSLTSFYPANNSYLNKKSPVVSLKICQPFFYKIKQFKLDHLDIASHVAYGDGHLTYKSAHLKDGLHTVEVILQPILSPFTIYRSWSFTIDTVKPKLKIHTPGKRIITNKLIVSLKGTTEPETVINLKINKTSASVKPDAKGLFKYPITLEKNKENIIAVESKDKAGNTTTEKLKVLQDSTIPKIYFSDLKDKAVVKKDEITIKGKITKTLSGIKLASGTADGKDIQLQLGEEKRTFTFSLKKLTDGRHTIIVKATDKAGNIGTASLEFTVNTTEIFGQASLTEGAVGKDVIVLQERLFSLGYLEKEDITGTFDANTLAAVATLQASKGYNPDGEVGPVTVGFLSNRVFIDLDTFTLTVYSPSGKTLKKYLVAIGSPKYPTPVGPFYVMELIKDPTWIPPDSPWAKDREPIKPGKGNPLGTRWIGLNSKAVGIHGTYYPWCVGNAVSHGCVRMRMQDIEELYGLLNIGSDVTISSKKRAEQKKKKKEN